jgi:hypothetical protein
MFEKQGKSQSIIQEKMEKWKIATKTQVEPARRKAWGNAPSNDVFLPV